MFPIFFLLLLLPTTAYSVQFQITQFDTNTPDIQYRGDAKPSQGHVDMNENYFFRVGWTIYAKKVPIWDLDTGNLTDFSTRFSFTIDTMGKSSYSDGLAFFLAPVGFDIPPNSAGGNLGLFNQTTIDSPPYQIVFVEFDSFVNPWDPNVTHVGINKNSIASANYTAWNASFHSGDTADVWIIYNATTKNLSVSWTYQRTSNSLEHTSLSYQIDLMKVLPESVQIGFSAAVGLDIEKHTLQSWEFNSTLDIKETSGKKVKKISLIVILTVVVVGVIVIASVMLWICKGKKKETTEIVNLTSINDALERGAGPRRFSYGDLVSATNNFSNERKLGQGGFGVVYKGYLTNLDMLIAVKKISRGSRQGKKEYITEVKIFSQLRHRNLVQLIGCCHDKGEFLLVYEFMPNGSLDFHLFGMRSPLSWVVRYKISLGLASALFYLHEEWEQCVVHRDIKSSNVMLDSSFNVKLGDFGLARLMDHELGPQTTGLAGTFGYMAPEYISTGRASKESDVYSFGVVALEIATGRRSVDLMGPNSDMRLVEWIWNLYGRGDLLLAVDGKLQTNFDEKQVECLMIIGLWCAHPDPNLRPSIRQAIQVLKFEAKIPILPMQMPIPMYHAPIQPLVSSSEPSLTNSLQQGR
uniref:Protein kinase domain-containing protein n=1 Tax=Fagus sylvatica TaxID=28930 RepID=A0A2N9EVV8_FAGSY